MIMESQLEKAFGKERKYWMRRQRSEYIDGIIYGLSIASRLLSHATKFKIPSWMFKEKVHAVKEATQ